MSFQDSLVVRLLKFRLLRAQALWKQPRKQSKPQAQQRQSPCTALTVLLNTQSLTLKRRLFTICLRNSSVGTLSRFLSVTTRFLQSLTFRRMLLTTLKKIFRRLKKSLMMTQKVSSLMRDTSTLHQSSRAVIRRKTRVSLQHRTRLIRL
jgi:hypothetical protein